MNGAKEKKGTDSASGNVAGEKKKRPVRSRRSGKADAAELVQAVPVAAADAEKPVVVTPVAPASAEPAIPVEPVDDSGKELPPAADAAESEKTGTDIYEVPPLPGVDKEIEAACRLLREKGYLVIPLRRGLMHVARSLRVAKSCMKKAGDRVGGKVSAAKERYSERKERSRLEREDRERRMREAAEQARAAQAQAQTGASQPQAAPETGLCLSCGARLTPNAKFCRMCGTRVG